MVLTRLRKELWSKIKIRSKSLEKLTRWGRTTSISSKCSNKKRLKLTSMSSFRMSSLRIFLTIIKKKVNLMKWDMKTWWNSGWTQVVKLKACKKWWMTGKVLGKSQWTKETTWTKTWWLLNWFLMRWKTHSCKPKQKRLLTNKSILTPYSSRLKLLSNRDKFSKPFYVWKLRSNKTSPLLRLGAYSVNFTKKMIKMTTQLSRLDMLSILTLMTWTPWCRLASPLPMKWRIALQNHTCKIGSSITLIIVNFCPLRTDL